MEIFDVFLLEAVLNGILLGGLLALLSLGLNLIFGVIDVVWICYAEMIMIGMYAVYTLHVQYHWPLLAAMAAGIASVAILGALMHQFVIRPVLAPSRSTSCWSPAACCSSSRRRQRSPLASSSRTSA